MAFSSTGIEFSFIEMTSLAIRVHSHQDNGQLSHRSYIVHKEMAKHCGSYNSGVKHCIVLSFISKSIARRTQLFTNDSNSESGSDLSFLYNSQSGNGSDFMVIRN